MSGLREGSAQTGAGNATQSLILKNVDWQMWSDTGELAVETGTERCREGRNGREEGREGD